MPQTKIFCRQDLSSSKFGVRKMPQATHLSLNMPPVHTPYQTVAHAPETPTTPGTYVTPKRVRDELNSKIMRNFSERKPSVGDASFVDGSLTSLGWLQNLSIMPHGPTTGTPPPSPQHDVFAMPSELTAMTYSPDMQVDPNSVLAMDYRFAAAAPTPLASSSSTTNHNHSSSSHHLPSSSSSAPSLYTSSSVHIKPEPEQQDSSIVRSFSFPSATPSSSLMYQVGSANAVETDYRNNPAKPHHAYAQLIAMAIKDSKESAITLSEIYNYIMENFMYYRQADTTWQNSIRHNLSLNKCFDKVDRKDFTHLPGKGGFWRIKPGHENEILPGGNKRRRGSPDTCITSVRSLPASATSSSSSSSSSSNKRQRNSGSTDSATKRTKHTLKTLKKEPEYDDIAETDLQNHDFDFGAYISQNTIKIGGQKFNMTDIIGGDENENSMSSTSNDSNTASPITNMSPPPSNESSNSNELLDTADMLFPPDFDFGDEMDKPVDFTTGVALDLSINGSKLEAPAWWDDFDTGIGGGLGELQNAGMHTPDHKPTEPYVHPWTEDKVDLDNAVASFHQECNDFDIENLTRSNTKDSEEHLQYK